MDSAHNQLVYETYNQPHYSNQGKDHWMDIQLPERKLKTKVKRVTKNV